MMPVMSQMKRRRELGFQTKRWSTPSCTSMSPTRSCCPKVLSNEFSMSCCRSLSIVLLRLSCGTSAAYCGICRLLAKLPRPTVLKHILSALLCKALAPPSLPRAEEALLSLLSAQLSYRLPASPAEALPCAWSAAASWPPPGAAGTPRPGLTANISASCKSSWQAVRSTFCCKTPWCGMCSAGGLTLLRGHILPVCGACEATLVSSVPRSLGSSFCVGPLHPGPALGSEEPAVLSAACRSSPANLSRGTLSSAESASSSVNAVSFVSTTLRSCSKASCCWRLASNASMAA
mmetsp:Transcript_147191/g.274159  ORF Transcript_147191/g.274159 Transcript_147191/m.274159 type:complete len:290 (-) Transcript_147191:106-975(-)